MVKFISTSSLSLKKPHSIDVESSKTIVSMGSRRFTPWNAAKVLKVAMLGLLFLATPAISTISRRGILSHQELLPFQYDKELIQFNAKRVKCESHFSACLATKPEKNVIECVWQRTKIEPLCGWTRKMRPEETTFFGVKHPTIDYEMTIQNTIGKNNEVFKHISNNQTSSIFESYKDQEIYKWGYKSDQIKFECEKDDSGKAKCLEEDVSGRHPLSTILNYASLSAGIGGVLAGIYLVNRKNH